MLSYQHFEQHKHTIIYQHLSIALVIIIITALIIALSNYFQTHFSVDLEDEDIVDDNFKEHFHET